jgi:hypothetical protein
MNKLYSVMIAGDREFSDYDMMTRKLDKLLFRIRMDDDCEIVSGGARGADLLGEKYAQDNDLLLRVVKANWDKYGKRAGYLRNLEMADIATHVIVFWNGKSRGSKMMIDIAKERRIPLRVIRYSA